MKQRKDRFMTWEYVLFAGITAAILFACVCLGSVSIPLREAIHIFKEGIGYLLGSGKFPDEYSASILLTVRLPRVICVALVGASLALAGAAVQGLLKNPLADGSTLGVSSGAALGAVIAIAFNITFPALPFAGTMVMAVLFAFLSLMAILSLAKAYGSRAMLVNKGKCAAIGSVEEVLSPSNLNPIYGMDVAAWMRQLLSQWET